MSGERCYNALQRYPDILRNVDGVERGIDPIGHTGSTHHWLHARDMDQTCIDQHEMGYTMDTADHHSTLNVEEATRGEHPSVQRWRNLLTQLTSQRDRSRSLDSHASAQATSSPQLLRLSPLPPRLMVVTKGHDVEAIQPLVVHGCRLFGENYIREGIEKWGKLRSLRPVVAPNAAEETSQAILQATSPPSNAHQPCEVHLIGAVQSNKLHDACDHFDAIQTVDRLKILQMLSQRMEAAARVPTLFIQVNVAGEEQKSGVAFHEADALIVEAQRRRLPLVGLMTIPPADVSPRPYFRALCALAQRHGLAELSMGMSADHAVALEEGATIIRVGTAIMGERKMTQATQATQMTQVTQVTPKVG